MRIGVGLSIPELATRGGKFSPASLFSGGVQGAWYAPDDFSTLFQDSAGTTPVTAVEQPVRLMLDKSQGGLGPELVTNGGFSSSSNWTLSNTTITGGNLVFGVASGYASQAISGTAGNYKLLVNKSVGFAGVGNLTFAFYNAGSIVGSAIPIGSATLTAGSGIVTASGSFDEIRMTCGTTDAYQVDSVSLVRAPGNHALAPNDASRPVLRARYNNLTYSEQFDNAAWTPDALLAFGSGSVANATTAPDGTTTADKIVLSAVSGQQRIYSSANPATVGTYTYSVYAKPAGYNFAGITIYDGVSYKGGAVFNISTGEILSSPTPVGTATIVAVGNGWYRISVSCTTAGSMVNSFTGIRAFSSAPAAVNGNTAGNGTDGVYIWGADLRTGSSAGTYQRIAAATDYATAGFLPYLAFDGTDDSFGTNSINFTATDKMSVCAGVTKLSDVLGMIVDGNKQNGSFSVYNDVQKWGGSLQGQTEIYGNTNNTFVSPITNVVTQLMDIGQALKEDELKMRVNGLNQTMTLSGTVAGTGNFGNWPLYIGRRGGASLPLNGRIYQMVVCGKTLSASELASTEAYVATKTGVTL